MPRTSAEAIERDRKSSRARYHKNREARLKVVNEYDQRKDRERPFIGWDSEGYDAFAIDSHGVCEKLPQRTMLFGCSVPDEYITGIDLSTKEMFDLVLRVESLYPDAYHVGFSFEYDINQMLKDLPWRMLGLLKVTGKVRWNGYRIEHIPHKYIRISKDGISATIYDAFGYFHCKYETALHKYGIGNSQELQRIHTGKLARGYFTYADLSEVTAYWKTEIRLLPLLMECIRDAAYGGGFYIHEWHGPGALAAYALRYNGVREWMSKKIPGNVKAAIRFAYAGGRFQAWRCGWYDGPVYTLDKNSAYVQAIAELPRLDNGKWVRDDPRNIRGPEDIARFGLYRISFEARSSGYGKRARMAGIPEPPYPLFLRSKRDRLTWPDRVEGWFWSPEARIVAGSAHAQFLECHVFQDDGTFPFKWVKDSYDVRVHLQEMGNPAEKAYKWTLAALYGAFARRVGWDRKRRTAPRSHELAWAGYITSHCRAAIYGPAAYAASKGALISVDTDGVTATCPFPENLVPEGFGTGLGQWKQEEYSGILYWQNGIYWLRGSDRETWTEAKSRGVPKGSISIDHAQEALSRASFVKPYRPAEIVIHKTRYIGYRQALNGQFKRWRVWQQEPFKLIMGGTGKGCHMSPFCRACKTGEGMHTITHWPSPEFVSTEHKLPWLQEEPDDMTVGELAADIFQTENEIFSEADLDDRL